ncbi:Na+/H+ antiporter NhaC [Cobetia crustatorum]|nr:Na+/H+ antiporter NhaC [Cobetia crustatorum]
MTRDLMTPQRPSLVMACLPIVATLAVLALQLFVFGEFTPHVPLVCGVAMTAIIGWKLGYGWSAMEEGMMRIVRVGLPSIAILILVGMTVGIWIASGSVPMIIYYGLKLISPEYFLAAAMLLCAVVSVALGTSWGTVGTVGLALMGIGAGFGIPPWWTAGAVVSGAFFGDKVSPLSDTTNLAPAVTGVNLFAHIRNMMPTTIPAMLIALVIYLVAGNLLAAGQTLDLERITAITEGLAGNFEFNFWVLMPPLLVMGLAIARMPALPALFVGVAAGAVVAFGVQGEAVKALFGYMQSGYTLTTGVSEIDTLLNRGGIMSMAWVILLVMIALAFGGLLEVIGCLESLCAAVLVKVRGIFGLQLAASSTAALTNVIAGDPYLSIALPGRMYAPVFRGEGYSTLNLSRSLEEGGTLISPLIPWNAGGAVVISSLGLVVSGGSLEGLLYIPLAFACWLSPLLGLLYTLFGRFILRADDAERAEWADKGHAVISLQQLRDQASVKVGGVAPVRPEA